MNNLIDNEEPKAYLNGKWDRREKKHFTSTVTAETDLHYEKISRHLGAFPAGKILSTQIGFFR